MNSQTPSRTALMVALCRTLGAVLPEPARLADDPYGALFAGRLSTAAVRALCRFPRLARRALFLFPAVARAVAFHQVRTRVLDEVLLEFVREPHRQLLLLGAGYDCRPARFARALDRTRVFEVDHPATQRRKRTLLARARLDSAGVSYLSWDFESRPSHQLAAALAAEGHDPQRPTLTIWEGVAVFLSAAAVDATVNAVRALSVPGSLLAFTYLDEAAIGAAGAEAQLARWLSRTPEPFRFGWRPSALPAWLAQRGFSLLWDHSAADEAHRLMPARLARLVPFPARRLAVAMAV